MSQQERAGVSRRLFFHPYGQRLIVLLGGYDKHERPSEHHQQQQIAVARKRLKDWKKRQR